MTYLQISQVNGTMLGVYSDWISGWYLYHNGSYELPSTCNQKGYKIPFCGSGYILVYPDATIKTNTMNGCKLFECHTCILLHSKPSVYILNSNLYEKP